MLLNSVIIVLREVLEAGLLISLLLATSKAFQIPLRWFLPAIISGLTGAILYALNLSTISELFDYTGQEITNATLQIIIYLSTALLVIYIHHSSKLKTVTGNKKHMILFMSIPIALALIREISEIFIYFSGFMHDSSQALTVLVGSCIGAGIGASIGVLIYFGLLSCNSRIVCKVSKIALAIMAAGILSQSIPLLIQADIMNASSPLWDTSNVLPEDSMIGQLLYAVLGYEATPAPMQVVAYLAGIFIIFFGLFINNLNANIND